MPLRDFRSRNLTAKMVKICDDLWWDHNPDIALFFPQELTLESLIASNDVGTWQVDCRFDKASTAQSFALFHRVRSQYDCTPQHCAGNPRVFGVSWIAVSKLIASHGSSKLVNHWCIEVDVSTVLKLCLHPLKLSCQGTTKAVHQRNLFTSSRLCEVDYDPSVLLPKS